MDARSLLFFLFAGSVLAEEATIPKGYAPERYERIWKKSPFTVASVLAATPADTTTFADNLSLVGLMTVGNKPLVTVVSNDSQETQLVEADKPNAAGLQVISFVNNLDPSKVEVVLKKGDVSGTLHFVINETPSAPPQGVPEQQPPRIISPRVQNGNIPRPIQQNPRTPGPNIGTPNNPTIIRRRTITLPGANRPATNTRVAPQRPNPQRGTVIPPP